MGIIAIKKLKGCNRQFIVGHKFGFWWKQINGKMLMNTVGRMYGWKLDNLLVAREMASC